MAINTLYEYYKSKGQKLPSIAERSKVYEQSGLGSAGLYQGTYSQNVALLGKLQAQPEPKPTPAPPVASPVSRVEAGSAQPTLSPSAPTLPAQMTISGQQMPTNVGLFQQYQTSVEDRLKELEAERNKLLEAQAQAPKQYDIYQQVRTERGLEPLQKQAESLDERLARMEEAIYSSEKDIRDRTIKSGGIVTESQVQRLVSSESQPLIDEYRRLLAERNRLGQRISGEETTAKELAGLKYGDITQSLGIAEQRLKFKESDFDTYRSLAKEFLGASQKDIEDVIDMAKAGDKTAEEEIDLAIRLANLANATPQGTSFEIGGQTIAGVKPPTTYKPTQTESDLATYQDVANQLEASKGQDGYANTALYGQLKAKYPQVFKWLAPEEWLNPNDATAKKYFQTTAGAIKKEEQDPFEAIINKALEGLNK